MCPIQWTDNPTDHPGNLPLRLVRTPAATTIQGYCTSLEPIGAYTHYASNRTIPCEGVDECKWCQDGYSRRWHGYLSILLIPTLEHVILELTATAHDALANYHKLHGTLRAAKIRAYRPSKRPNGRVHLETSPGDETRVRLPDPPNVRKILCHIWNVQYTEPQPNWRPKMPSLAVNVDDAGDDGRYRNQ